MTFRTSPADEMAAGSVAISRRRFIECTVVTGAGVLLAGRRLTAAPAMFVSLNGAVSPGVSGSEKIRLAARLGYGGVDWDFGPARKAGLEATKALFDETSLVPTIVNLPMQNPLGGDEAGFKAKLPQLEDDAAFAADVGCRRMMVVLSPAAARPKDEQRRIAVERFSAIAGALAKSQIRLGLEFLGPLYMRTGPGRGGEPRYPFIWTLPETVALARDCGPNAGAVLDVWHWHHSGGTVADILATDASRIVHVHLSDAEKQAPEDVRDNQRKMPGEGIVDLTGFLRALQKIGYEGGVSPEPLGRIPGEMNAEEAARLGLETTRAAMQKAGVLS